MDDLDPCGSRKGVPPRRSRRAAAAPSGTLRTRGRGIEKSMDVLRLLEARVKELKVDPLPTRRSSRRRSPSSGPLDITEEVVRFRGHLEHWRALSDSPSPAGVSWTSAAGDEQGSEHRRIQGEGPAVSELVVSLNAELEKMREQVQMSNSEAGTAGRRGVLYVVSAPSGQADTVVERLVQLVPSCRCRARTLAHRAPR